MSVPINHLERQAMCPHPYTSQTMHPMPDGGAYTKCEACGKILETINAAQRQGLE